jgi:renal tumor antigen
VRKLGEGTFSEVLKAESVKTKQKVAIKCMKSHFDNIEKVLNFGIFDIGTKSKRN